MGRDRRLPQTGKGPGGLDSQQRLFTIPAAALTGTGVYLFEEEEKK